MYRTAAGRDLLRQSSLVPQTRRVLRRNFIVWWLGGLLAASVAAIAAPLLVYLYPPEGSNRRLKITVNLSPSLKNLRENVPVRFEAPRDQAFVLETGGGDNSPGDPAFAGWAVKGSKTGGKTLVFGVNCPHLGCDVGFDKGKDVFLCPCHGSEFDLDGTVRRGPAAAPMAKLNWRPGPQGEKLEVDGVSLKA